MNTEQAYETKRIDHLGIVAEICHEMSKWNTTSMAADVEGARQNNGANVQQWQYGGGANQLWRLVRH